MADPTRLDTGGIGERHNNHQKHEGQWEGPNAIDNPTPPRLAEGERKHRDEI